MSEESVTELDAAALSALGHVHHAYFLGLQLTVATRCDDAVMGDWMFRLFRRQHEEKFLSSFAKLGLTQLPDAVACAQYHVLSNSLGGVPVEYAYESDRKAWVRFRYPRWMFDGATICGVTEAVSAGFLRGWYAHNGVSLNNPRLGFVCVSQDMTGEFGLCGYFLEHDYALSDSERLRYAPGEMPPPYIEANQPRPPQTQWSETRLAKANRNYALDYVRNGLSSLIPVVGLARARELGERSARLIGLQYQSRMMTMLGLTESEGQAMASAEVLLVRLFEGMGDTALGVASEGGRDIEHGGLRVLRGLEHDERLLVAACWRELWRGALRAFREMLDLSVSEADNQLTWHIRPMTPGRLRTSGSI